jgi:hypothetical protein
MRAWIEQREGSSVLVRTGEALVTAVTPVSPQDIGFQGPDTQPLALANRPTPSLLMVELHCLPQRRPRSIRVTVRAIVDADTDIAERARAAEGLETPVSWLIEWHRRADIPARIPIEHLHLPTDATAVLVALSRAESIAEQIDDVSLELS